MEDRCNFIWQLIEESPELNRQLHELENDEPENQDKRISGLIEFYRDVDLTIECVLDAYQNTRILNNFSYLIRMRS